MLGLITNTFALEETMSYPVARLEEEQVADEHGRVWSDFQPNPGPHPHNSFSPSSHSSSPLLEVIQHPHQLPHLPAGMLPFVTPPFMSVPNRNHSAGQPQSSAQPFIPNLSQQKKIHHLPPPPVYEPSLHQNTQNFSSKPKHQTKMNPQLSELQIKLNSIPIPDIDPEPGRQHSFMDFYPNPLKVPLSNIFLINNNFFPHFLQARDTFSLPYRKVNDPDDMDLFPFEDQMDKVPWMKSPNGLYDYVDPYYSPTVHHEIDLWKQIYSSVGWKMTPQERVYRLKLQEQHLRNKNHPSQKQDPKKRALLDDLLSQYPHGFIYNEEHTEKLSNSIKEHKHRTKLLSVEIRNYYHYMMLTKTEYLARFNLIERITQSVNHLDPSLLVYVYGSFSSYTSLPQSDVDLTIITIEQYRYIRRIQRIIRSLFEFWCGNMFHSPERPDQVGYLSTSTAYLRSEAVRKLVLGLVHLEEKEAKFCRICFNPLFSNKCRCDPEVALAIEKRSLGSEGAWMEETNEKGEVPFCSSSGVLNMKQLLSIQLTPRLQHRLDFSSPILCSHRILNCPEQLVRPTIHRLFMDRRIVRKDDGILNRFAFFTQAEKQEIEMQNQERMRRGEKEEEKRRTELGTPTPSGVPTNTSSSNTVTPPIRVQQRFLPKSSFAAELETHQFSLPPPPKISESTFLSKLADHLSSYNVVSKAELLRSARVPIIKITDRLSGVHCDVGFGTMTGIINTDFLRCLLVVYPQANELIILLKAFLAKLKLNEPYTGGLGGYALSLLVVSHLQQFERNFGLDYKTVESGELLRTFFQLYGEHPSLPDPPNGSPRYSCERFGVSVRGKGLYLDIAELKEKVPDLFPKGSADLPIFIEDPLDPTNNTSRSSFNYGEIRRHFREAYVKLQLNLPPPIPPRCFATVQEHIVNQLPADILNYYNTHKAREEQNANMVERPVRGKDQIAEEIQEENARERDQHDPQDPQPPPLNASRSESDAHSNVPQDETPTPAHNSSESPNVPPLEPSANQSPILVSQITLPVPPRAQNEKEHEGSGKALVPSLLMRIVEQDSSMIREREQMCRFNSNPVYFTDPAFHLRQDTGTLITRHPVKQAIPNSLFEKAQKIERMHSISKQRATPIVTPSQTPPSVSDPITPVASTSPEIHPTHHFPVPPEIQAPTPSLYRQPHQSPPLHHQQSPSLRPHQSPSLQAQPYRRENPVPFHPTQQNTRTDKNSIRTDPILGSQQPPRLSPSPKSSLPDGTSKLSFESPVFTPQSSQSQQNRSRQQEQHITQEHQTQLVDTHPPSLPSLSGITPYNATHPVNISNTNNPSSDTLTIHTNDAHSFLTSPSHKPHQPPRQISPSSFVPLQQSVPLPNQGPPATDPHHSPSQSSLPESQTFPSPLLSTPSTLLPALPSPPPPTQSPIFKASFVPSFSSTVPPTEDGKSLFSQSSFSSLQELSLPQTQTPSEYPRPRRNKNKNKQQFSGGKGLESCDSS
ncbi:putative DNA polymerase sigma [Blattamonas nauphoetae]|uniref:DNA polymerase sigma n=1 Tax=Blattamonas nauphoetae TaxID=2049346 RepID=A0ABQ9YLZ7_9EUKA|nr:putative DNA polymerase sigma [Blattamonas nauphoetae]